MLNNPNGLFSFRDGLEGADLHLHADALGGFDSGHLAFAADEGDMDAAGGHQAVAFLQAVAVFALFLGFLSAGTNQEEIEHHNHEHNHDDGLGGLGNVEEDKV